MEELFQFLCETAVLDFFSFWLSKTKIKTPNHDMVENNFAPKSSFKYCCAPIQTSVSSPDLHLKCLNENVLAMTTEVIWFLRG